MIGGDWSRDHKSSPVIGPGRRRVHLPVRVVQPQRVQHDRHSPPGEHDDNINVNMTHFTQQDNILQLHIAGQLLLREDAMASLGGAVQGSGERGLSSGITE